MTAPGPPAEDPAGSDPSHRSSLPSLGAAEARIYRWTENRLRSSHWLALLTTAVLFAGLFLAFPSYDGIEDASWRPVLDTAQHPFKDLGFSSGEHAPKLTFRLTVPLLGRLLHLSIPGYLILQGLGGIALIAGFAFVASRCGHRDLGRALEQRRAPIV